MPTIVTRTSHQTPKSRKSVSLWKGSRLLPTTAATAVMTIAVMAMGEVTVAGVVAISRVIGMVVMGTGETAISVSKITTAGVIMITITTAITTMMAIATTEMVLLAISSTMIEEVMIEAAVD